MKFRVDASEDHELFGKSLESLYRSVCSRNRKMGFTRLAKPTVPEVVKPLLECEVDGRRMFLNDRRLEEVPAESMSIVPPSDVSKMDQEQIGNIIQYITAEIAFMSGELTDLESLQVAARMRHKRLLRMVEIDLRDRKNPATGRKYSEKARKEQAQTDVRVQQAETDLFEAQMAFKDASTVLDGWKKIVEALNRNRMVRSDEDRRYYHSPSYEHDINMSAERSKATRRRWEGRRRSSG